MPKNTEITPSLVPNRTHHVVRHKSPARPMHEAPVAPENYRESHKNSISFSLTRLMGAYPHRYGREQLLMMQAHLGGGQVNTGSMAFKDVAHFVRMAVDISVASAMRERKSGLAPTYNFSGGEVSIMHSLLGDFYDTLQPVYTYADIIKSRMPAHARLAITSSDPSEIDPVAYDGLLGQVDDTLAKTAGAYERLKPLIAQRQAARRIITASE